MNARGFTLAELLVAMVLGLLVAGASVAFAASVRQVFLVEPETLDAMRRVREGGMALVTAITNAGGDQALADGVSPLPALVPLVTPLVSLDGSGGDVFRAVSVIRAVPGVSGRLAVQQPGVAGPLTLEQSTGVCPSLPIVCGFQAGDIAVIADGWGRTEVFEVREADDALGQLRPARPLAYAYPAGAWVTAARADRIGLLRQPDGSQNLVRFTAAGAQEPMLDGVVDLQLDVWGQARAPWLRDAASSPGLAQYGLYPPAADVADANGIYGLGEHCMAVRLDGTPQSPLSDHAAGADGLMRLQPADFVDGPWCPQPGAAAAFDADLFRIRRIDIRLRVEVLPPEFRGVSGPLFVRPGTAAHDTARWVKDRMLSFSVAVGR